MENINIVIFITATTLIHGAVFFYDEYLLHKKRPLSQKEINSSLFGGAFYLVTVALTIFTSFSPLMSKVYIALAFVSCVLIVLNELYYPVLEVNERLSHGALYILHPLILYAFYSSWKMDLFNTNMTYWMLQLCYLILGFKAMSYHAIYYNYIHKK